MKYSIFRQKIKPTPFQVKSKGGRPTPAPVARPAQPWYIPPIQCFEPEDGVFFAQVTLISSSGFSQNNTSNELKKTIFENITL